MIPEVVVAMLACARIGAPHNVVFGGFSAEAVRERMEFSDAKVLITVDGASRKGRIAPVKAGRGRRDGRPRDARAHRRRRLEGHRVRDAGRVATSGTTRSSERPTPDCPAEPMDAEDPLYILYTSGSTAKPKGILHTTGGYLTGVSATHRYIFDLHPEEDVYWCAADVGWVTGHSYIVYGPLVQRRNLGDVRGRPGLSPPGDLVGDHRALRRDDPLHRADGDPHLHQVGRRSSRSAFDLSSLRLLGSVGEPINPKAWLWYHKVIGGGRCPIVDTWWQTETGAIMITPLPGDHRDQAGLGDAAVPGHQRRGRR